MKPAQPPFLLYTFEHALLLLCPVPVSTRSSLLDRVGVSYSVLQCTALACRLQANGKQLTLTQRPPHPLVCSCAYVWQLLLDMCKSLPPPACLFFAIECLLYAQRDSPWLRPQYRE
jgi:hypothetical protein